MIDGRVRARTALYQHLPADDTAVPFNLVEQFAIDLDQYTEIIVGPGARPVGFMTHGEGPQFTARVQVALDMLGLPEAARAHHRELATWFEHTRGFAKFEWHTTPDGRVEPLAAVYFRRRPHAGAVLDRLDTWGVPASARERIAALAATLEKDTIHFVAAAFRPDQPVHHKLYFSQWLTPDTHEATTKRLARVFELYGFPAAAVDAWRPAHERCTRDGEPTVFLSTSVAEAGASPSFKIDYPDLQPAQVALWAPAARRPEVTAEVERAKAMSGGKYLTYLGTRFTPGADGAALKYYADVPGSQ